MIHIQKEKNYDQYWFRIKTNPFNLYPDSEGCKKGKPKLMKERMVGITIPKNLDMSKSHKYILNLDFNIDGKASDWFCNNKFYKGWGGVISNVKGFTDNNNCLMKKYMIFLKSLLKNGYVLVHTSLTSEDVYYNQPCKDKEPCKKCWFPNNPDEDYLKRLFNMIKLNSYPKELSKLKLNYNSLNLLGYSVGAGAVSRYINEFPFLKTINGNYPFPDIKVGIMIAGGSLWCYSKDCKGDAMCRDKNGKPDPNFAPCFDPDMKVRGCCPHNLSEPNYDNGKIPWSKHPPMVLAQSTDDDFADPMASTFYTNVMKSHGVPVLNTMVDSTDHGIGSNSQIIDIIDWLNKYNSKSKKKRKDYNKNNNSSYTIFLSFIILFVLLGVVLFSASILNIIEFKNIIILMGIILLCLVLTLGLYYGLNRKKKIRSDNEIIKALDNLPNLEKVTAGQLFDKVVDIKNKIFSDHPNIGGVLVHLMELEDMETIVNTKPFVFNLSSPGTDDCAQTAPKPGQNGPTCSAWSYLRKDLPPIVYSYPTSAPGGAWWYPNVGIIVNPSVIWPLITTMGIVDSATNGRNCGAQDPNWDFNIFDANNGWGRCNPTVFDKSGKKSKDQKDYCIYQSLCKRTSCPVSCTYEKDIENTNCRMRNSGGGLHNVTWVWDGPNIVSWDCPKENTTNTWNSQTWPIPGFKNGTPSCYKAEEIEWKDICPSDKKQLDSNNYGKNTGNCSKWAVFNPDFKCYLNNPHVYHTTDTPPLDSDPVSGKLIQNNTWRTNFSASNIDRNYTYIGNNRDQNKGGSTFSQQTWKNCILGNNANPTSCNITEDSTIPISLQNVMRTQAKFLKKDWGRWLKELLLMWNYIYKTLDKNQGYKDRKNPVDGQKGNWNYNWIYGNPCNTGSWWENEVNIYINPEMAKDENSSVNKLYRTGVLGFFYIGKTCEDFVSDLPTGTFIPKQNGDNCTFKNAKERCKGYLCNLNIDQKYCISDVNGKKVTYEDVLKIEKQRMEKGKKLVQTLVSKFNNKYRGGNKPKVIGYKLMTSSNAFQSYSALNKLFTGSLSSKDIFIKL